MTPIQISKTGTQTASSGLTVNFSDSDFHATVGAYNPALHEAPLVVGHPKTNAPAYGWVESMQFNQGVLAANPRQVDPEFAEMVNAGRYKKVSASFFHPDSPANPAPGVYYLRHVGFLGAQAPAVKGLKDAEFSEGDDDIVTVEFSQGDEAAGSPVDNLVKAMLQFFNLAKSADAEQLAEFAQSSKPGQAAKPESAQSTQQQETDMSDQHGDTADFAERQHELDERAAKIAQREAALARREHEDFAESLVTAGKLLPKDKPGLVEFLAGLPAEATLEFAEGDETVKKPAIDWLKSWLVDLPKQVDFSEHAGEEADDATAVEFAAPAGAVVNKDSLDLHRKALVYQSKNQCSYAAAVNAVGGK